MAPEGASMLPRLLRLRVIYPLCGYSKASDLQLVPCRTPDFWWKSLQGRLFVRNRPARSAANKAWLPAMGMKLNMQSTVLTL